MKPGIQGEEGWLEDKPKGSKMRTALFILALLAIFGVVFWGLSNPSLK